MSKNKKIKKKPRNPKLSSADKLIYCILLVVAIFLFFAPIFIFYTIKNKIVFADSNVITYTSTGELWMVLPSFINSLLLTIPLANAYTDREPILHRKKLKRNTKKQKHKISAVFITVCAVIYIAMWIPVTGALYSRNQITAKSVSIYTMFNKFKDEIPLSSAQSAEISITSRTSARARSVIRHWVITYKIKFDNGKTYYFNTDADKTLKLYALFPDLEISVKNAERLDRYLDDNRCTPEQTEALRKIFGAG